ncbi:protein kinase [bacterium]|nr:protein kinase [bacterium]
MAVANKKKKIFDKRYEILSILGRGSRSVVYHAKYIDGEREEVALKVLLDKRDEVFPSDLLRKEALAMVSSRHKYVIRLDDFHSLGDLCYLTMELANGGDLRRYLERKGGKLSATQTELFLLQAAEALDFIHKAGILHRDLKPENILVVDDQSIRIGDFGVAILPGEKSSLEELRTGVGTLEYLSPEVLNGEPFDKRADLYALGITFYELLAGVHPFAGATLAEQAGSQIPPSYVPLSEREPDAPAHLLSAITTLMSVDPNERFQSARDLIQALVSFDVSGLEKEAAGSKGTAKENAAQRGTSSSAKAESATPPKAERASSPGDKDVAPKTPEKAAPKPPEKAVTAPSDPPLMGDDGNILSSPSPSAPPAAQEAALRRKEEAAPHPQKATQEKAKEPARPTGKGEASRQKSPFPKQSSQDEKTTSKGSTAAKASTTGSTTTGSTAAGTTAAETTPAEPAATGKGSSQDSSSENPTRKNSKNRGEGKPSQAIRPSSPSSPSTVPSKADLFKPRSELSPKETKPTPLKKAPKPQAEKEAKGASTTASSPASDHGKTSPKSPSSSSKKSGGEGLSGGKLLFGVVVLAGIAYGAASFLGGTPEEGTASEEKVPALVSQTVDQDLPQNPASDGGSFAAPSGSTQNPPLFGIPQGPLTQGEVLPGGVYSGELVLGKSKEKVPFSVISLETSKQLIIAIGIHGFTPIVVDTAGATFTGDDSGGGELRVASKGFLFTLSSTIEGDNVTGTLYNEITGERSTWRAAP